MMIKGSTHQEDMTINLHDGNYSTKISEGKVDRNDWRQTIQQY